MAPRKDTNFIDLCPNDSRLGFGGYRVGVNAQGIWLFPRSDGSCQQVSRSDVIRLHSFISEELKGFVEETNSPQIKPDYTGYEKRIKAEEHKSFRLSQNVTELDAKLAMQSREIDMLRAANKALKSEVDNKQAGIELLSLTEDELNRKMSSGKPSDIAW